LNLGNNEGESGVKKAFENLDGKSFIVTDIMYNTRLVRQNLTVNFARVTPDDKTDTLFQVYLTPGLQHETHLCTGYAVAQVTAWELGPMPVSNLSNLSISL
jgi:hypothetical protein